MWARPSNSRVAHAFDSESRSLCGKWFLPAAKDVGRREPPDAPCCAACARAFAASPRSADPPVLAPPSPEPRRPVAGWATQRNGDETWWVLDLAARHLAELYAIVKRYPDRPLTWAVALDPLDEDCASWAEGTADDPDAAMLRAEDAAAAMIDAANAALGRKP